MNMFKNFVFTVFILLTLSAINASAEIKLTAIGTYASGIFDGGGAEIVAHDPKTQRVFIVNLEDQAIDVISITDPTNPSLLFSIDLTPYGSQANSVDVFKGIVAVAVENETKTSPGQAVFFDANGNFLSAVQVGALPDMITFTPDGKKVLVANEGEPDTDYEVDPVGSVSIIDLSPGVQNITQANVSTAGFQAFNNAILDSSIRIFGPDDSDEDELPATVAQDIEPEYITVSDDSKTAWVTLQENNAIGILNLKTNSFTKLVGLGFKNHNLIQNSLDASNEDDGINIQPWPVFGMYLPDGIAHYNLLGQTFLVTANEGDTREWDAFTEFERIGDGDFLDLDPTAFPNASTLQEDENLGRLNASLVDGDTDGDGDLDRLFSYGARSFSIWTSAGKLIYDSGDDFEQITAALQPDFFNSNNDDNDSFDNRSDDKGPEPEGVTVAKIFLSTYAFIGLERMGGVMVYNITNPFKPKFVQYVNNRDFSVDAEEEAAGDLGPEGIIFIPALESPIKKPLLVVGNEISGTTTIYRIDNSSLLLDLFGGLLF